MSYVQQLMHTTMHLHQNILKRIYQHDHDGHEQGDNSFWIN